MRTRTRMLGAAFLVAAAMAVAPLMADTTSAQQQRQSGLVNVAVGDVTVLENVAIGLAAQVAANICGVTVGNVAALASNAVQVQETRQVCEIEQGDQTVPVTITPAQGNGNNGNNG